MWARSLAHKYVPGKGCSWVLGFCLVLFVGCMHMCLILLDPVVKVVRFKVMLSLVAEMHVFRVCVRGWGYRVLGV